MPLDHDQSTLLNAVASEDGRSPHSMPGWYYSDPSLFEIEKKHVLSAGWMCSGHSSEIPKPGMYYTVTLADEAVVVLRDRDGKLRAYSNVCRHRGMKLVEGAGKAMVLTCPYHAWSYHLDGTLNKAPYMDEVESFDPAACSLPEFKVEEWMGFIFVNISGDAAPLAPGMAALEPHLANYRPEDRHTVPTWMETWQVNWKSLIENFMEGYHLSVTHAKTLDHITPTELCEKLAKSTQFTAYRSNYRPEAEQRKPYPAELTEKERRSSVLFTVYPNFLITVGPNCAVFLILLPEAAEEVNIKMGVLVQEGADDLPATRAYIELAHEFNAEDKATLEAMQKNTRTAHRPIAPLAPEQYEGTVWDFTRHVAQCLTTSG
ncbi:MAG: aromatic ring-hydroxylating dioxygenase subunit alpha [Alphaproteobacteria bacterium]|nr:aromatic ring-hydroxylating dioxygenase subunit alpha [Alphaproteobacteria bacterium]